MTTKLKGIIKKAAHLFPDKIFLKILYFVKFNKKLNLRNPQTYNEKLQWLKIYDRNPFYTILVDKLNVKKYVANKIGTEYVIELLGEWNNFDDINFDFLPNQFVLKTNHGCGGIYICKDKTLLNKNEARAILEASLKSNYYKNYREWPYKGIKPKIIAESFMVDESGEELKDYKFFCFNGEVKAMFIARDRSIGKTKFDFFDAEFNQLPIKQHYPNSEIDIAKPKNFDKMKELASILSKGIPHVRIDFYNVNGKIYFGEYTFYHFSGFEQFEPEKWDKIFGDWIDISIIKSKKV